MLIWKSCNGTKSKTKVTNQSDKKLVNIMTINSPGRKRNFKDAHFLDFAKNTEGIFSEIEGYIYL
jgi:surfactin synthase thioesterase subunit